MTQPVNPRANTGAGTVFFGEIADVTGDLLQVNGADIGTVFSDQLLVTTQWEMTLVDQQATFIKNVMSVDTAGRVTLTADLVVGNVAPGGTAPNSLSYNATGGIQFTQGIAGVPPLIAATAGAAANQYMNIWLNGNHYKIALLLP